MTGELVAGVIVLVGVVVYLIDTFFHLGIFDKLADKLER